MTNIDETVNFFFAQLGGLDFLGLVFAMVIILVIIMSLIRPFDF
jgi:hypothetical protein